MNDAAMMYTNPITVYNEGGNDIPGYGIMRVSSDSDYRGNTGRSYLKVNRPDTTYRRTYLVAGPQGIKASSYGVAYTGRETPVWALWDSSATTPAIDAEFGPMVDAFTLMSDSYGFVVVGKSETSPFRRVLVKQVDVTGLVVTLDADLTYQSSCTASVRRVVSGSSRPDSSLNITVYDMLLTSGKKLASGGTCDAVIRGGRWVVTAGPCPTT